MSTISSLFIPDAYTSSTLADTGTSEEVWVDGEKQIGKEQFLTLLVAQMKYQDPLNPMEGTEFTSQLAQFSSLEQLYNLNDGIGNIYSSIASYQSLGLLGSTVKAEGEALSLQEGVCSNGSFAIDEEAALATVSVYDANGNLVKTITLEDLNAGEHSIDWDGTDFYGEAVDDGVYYFDVEAYNYEGSSLETTTYMLGEITGITFTSDGVPIPVMNGLQILVGNIVEINGKPANQQAGGSAEETESTETESTETETDSNKIYSYFKETAK